MLHLKKIAMCTNVFCKLHGTCPCKGQEKSATSVSKHMYLYKSQKYDLYAVRTGTLEITKTIFFPGTQLTLKFLP